MYVDMRKDMLIETGACISQCYSTNVKQYLCVTVAYFEPQK